MSAVKGGGIHRRHATGTDVLSEMVLASLAGSTGRRMRSTCTLGTQHAKTELRREP